MNETRFKFGKNWEYFLNTLDETQLREAELSLKEMLGVDTLKDRTFLDVGCGSGIFSLAARRLGARVTSFDYDADSVACAEKLKKQFFDGSEDWKVGRGDALDGKFLQALGKFDIVYSWGVLHHTGDMWKALDNISGLCREGGTLFVSLYNDQGLESRLWKAVKKTYNLLPDPLKPLVSLLTFLRMWTLTILKDSLSGHPMKTLGNYKQNRGMSVWRDVVDWAGGYPFEVAKPEEVTAFFVKRGYKPVKLKRCTGSGCNEFVFSKG